MLNRRRLLLVQLWSLVLALVLVASASASAYLLAGMLFVGMLGTAMTQGLIAYAATIAAPTERGRVVGTTQAGVLLACCQRVCWPGPSPIFQAGGWCIWFRLA